MTAPGRSGQWSVRAGVALALAPSVGVLVPAAAGQPMLFGMGGVIGAPGAGSGVGSVAVVVGIMAVVTGLVVVAGLARRLASPERASEHAAGRRGGPGRGS